jgi:predicted hotdog family 3-hydroxylacyl-ACP dehydratase
MRTPAPISTLPPVGELVPHDGAMRLIDELLAADDTQCVARDSQADAVVRR